MMYMFVFRKKVNIFIEYTEKKIYRDYYPEFSKQNSNF